MSQKDIYISIADVTGVEQVNISESYGQTSSVATVTCQDTSLGLNSPISIDMGYTDSHTNIFQGRIKTVTRSRPEGLYKLTCRDTLVDASDMFMVSSDPEAPWSRNNISAEDLVGALLSEAGITNYSPSVPMSFTYGLNAPVEFNFVSVMDAIGEVCRTLVWHVWADAGTVYFSDVKPYYRTGAAKDEEYGESGNSDDTISHCLRTYGGMGHSGPCGTLKPIVTSLEFNQSDEDLRNKVMVFGREDITATASQSSPYLPPDFYKTVVIASSLIDSGSMAQSAADFNLKRLNRLTEVAQVECLGDSTIRARQFIDIYDADTGIDGYWFVETVNHVITAGGYTLRLGLRK